jgi:hypothetical protein
LFGGRVCLGFSSVPLFMYSFIYFFYL